MLFFNPIPKLTNDSHESLELLDVEHFKVLDSHEWCSEWDNSIQGAMDMGCRSVSVYLQTHCFLNRQRGHLHILFKICNRHEEMIKFTITAGSLARLLDSNGQSFCVRFDLGCIRMQQLKKLRTYLIQHFHHTKKELPV